MPGGLALASDADSTEAADGMDADGSRGAPAPLEVTGDGKSDEELESNDPIAFGENGGEEVEDEDDEDDDDDDDEVENARGKSEDAVKRPGEGATGADVAASVVVLAEGWFSGRVGSMRGKVASRMSNSNAARSAFSMRRAMK